MATDTNLVINFSFDCYYISSILLWREYTHSSQANWVKARLLFMYKHSLTPDDLPPVKATLLDEILLRQLAEAIGSLFHKTSNGSTLRSLLSSCHWYFKANTYPMTLVIFCYDIKTYWQMMNAIPDILNKLKQFSNAAKIRLFSPLDKGVPWEVAMDELSEDG